MTTGDLISITGLRVRAHHGVFDFERENGQDFIIDLEVSTDLSTAAAGDDLSQTIHYGELAEAVAADVASEPVDLIETLAERIARIALSFPAAERVRVTVHKPQAPVDLTFDDIAVSVVRDRSFVDGVASK